MKISSLLIVGAGISSNPADLPTDKDFLFRTYYDGTKSTAPEFLQMAFNRLYNQIALDQNTIFYDSTDYQKERLEIAWSEIYANRYAPKFVFREGVEECKHIHEIDKIKKVLLKLARQEETAEYKYYYHHAFADTDGKSPYQMLFLFAGWELRKSILKIYGSKRFADLKHDDQEKYTKLLDVIFGKSKEKKIISFNYDIILDEAIEKIGGKYYIGIDGPKPGKVHFIKPHGSVNWYENNGKIIETEGPVPMNRIGFKDGDLHWHSIIPPLDVKFSRQYDHDREGIVTKIYAESLINQFKISLLEATDLTIIGYSFPIADQRIRSVMFEIRRERERSRNPFKFVRYIDPILDESRDRTMREDAKFTIKQLFHSEKFLACPCSWVEWVESGQEIEF